MLNSFSISLGMKAAKPDMRNPSLAPAKFKKLKVGLTMRSRKALGISRNFLKASNWLFPWASETFSVWMVEAPGSAGGNDIMGMAIKRQMKPESRNPIHQAPTQTLLFCVRPNLKEKLKFKTTERVDKVCWWKFLKLEKPVGSNEYWCSRAGTVNERAGLQSWGRFPSIKRVGRSTSNKIVKTDYSTLLKS